ncbi:MAG: paraquat-inducible protein A [Pseudomonadales bacterium]
MTNRPALELRALRLLLPLALACYVAGIYLPIMTLTKFYFIENSFSILSGLTDLYTQERYALVALIALLSLVLPLLKLLLLARVLYSAAPVGDTWQKGLNLVHSIGRWAMLDVLVVAVLLVSVKLGALASVALHSGLYWFAACVLLTMWISQRAGAALAK